MKFSDNAIKLIKEFEGFQANPYSCPAGVPTIGYGTTRYEDGTKVKLTDKPITEKEADALLRNHVNGLVGGLAARIVSLGINQNQTDALLSFIYNLGWGAFDDSTLLKLLRQKQYARAAQEFDKWVYANGNKLSGLIRRRQAEKALFLKGV